MMTCPMCKNPIYSNTSPDSEIFAGKTICEDCASNIHILLNGKNHAERQAAIDYVQKQMEVTHDESIRSALDTLIKSKPAPKPESSATNQEDSEGKNDESVKETANLKDNKPFENAGDKIMKAAEVIHMKSSARKAYSYLLIMGVVLILAGLIIRIPGGVLTTYDFYNGDKTDDYYFDDRYSAIDEYVGGDAYNYIIGACLVAGKTAGIIAAKAICFVGGAMCCGFGMTMKMLKKEDVPKEVHLLHSTDMDDSYGS